MKKRQIPTIVLSAASLVAALSSANAAVLYFDPNGTSPITAGTYTWDTTTLEWSTSSALTGSLVAWNSADAACFSAWSGSGTLPAITVDVNSTISCGGFFDGNEKPAGENVTFSGTGSLSLDSGVQALGVGGSDGNIVTMNIPLTGTGGGESEMDTVNTLNLNVNNTFTGQMILGPSTSGPGINLNNGVTTPFGTGTAPIINSSTSTRQINVQSGQPAAAIPNNWTMWNGTLLIVDGAANNLTLSGSSINLPSGITSTIELAPTTPSSGTATVYASGNVTGAGNLKLTTTSGTSLGNLVLSGNNSYTGTTTVNGGRLTLATANALGVSSQLILNGTASQAVLDPGGNLQAMNSTTLSVGASGGTIDFQAGAATVAFADSHAVTWGTGSTAILNIANVANDGSFTQAGAEAGADEIVFGSSASALTAAQLAEIELGGNAATLGYAELDSNGYLYFNPVPEPSTLALTLLGGFGALFAARRRSA